MNEIFYSAISGINIVIGIMMIAALISGPTKDWGSATKMGFFLMAVGLIGQAVYVIVGANLSDPIWDQLWSFKDIGMWFFTIPLINKWIDHSNIGRG